MLISRRAGVFDVSQKYYWLSYINQAKKKFKKKTFKIKLGVLLLKKLVTPYNTNSTFVAFLNEKV